MMKSIKNFKRILITGAAGFIGGCLKRHYEDKGFVVAGIDRKDFDGQTLDILDWNKLKTFVCSFNPDIISHQAAQSSVEFSTKNEQFDAENNIIGTINMIKLANDVDAKLIYANTGGAGYGSGTHLREDDPQKPESPYALSKTTGEKYIELLMSRLRWASLRYANVYGPQDDRGVVSKFMDNLKHGRKCEIFGDGNQTRDYIYIDDLIALHDLMVEGSFGAYNCSTGIGTTTKEVYNLVASQMNIDWEPTFIKARAGDIADSVLDNRKAKGLGWEPKIDLQTGIKLMLDEYRRIDHSVS